MNRSSRDGTSTKPAVPGERRRPFRRGWLHLRQGGRCPRCSRSRFHARPGETIALVGTTGAGKSTLVNLLTRFYEYDTGEILIDDTPIREFGMRRLREMIGVVTQESFLFNGTIRENLLMGRPDASDAEVLAAAEAANAHGFIDRLPKGPGQRRGRARSEVERGRKAAASRSRARC